MDPQFNNPTPPSGDTTPQGQLSPQPQPMQPQMPAQFAPASVKKASKLKFLLIGVLLSVFLFGGSAAAYIKLVVNSPENVWKRAMESSQKGLDAIMQTTVQNSSGTSKLDGTFKMVSPVAADGSVHAVSNDKNAELMIEGGAMGTRLDAEMRMIDSEASENPDIYFKVNGLDSIASMLGIAGSEYEQYAQLIQTADGQWYGVDHTLLDQFLTSMNQGSTTTPELTQDDIRKIGEAVVGVVKNNLLSNDPNKAVFEVVQQVGKEDFEGTSTFRYEVGVNKEHLKTFLSDFKLAVGQTKLAEVIASTSGKSFEETVALDDIFRSIDNQDFTNAKADVWVESSGRYVRNVRIYPMNEDKQKNYIDIGMPYQGGDVLPFIFKVVVDNAQENGSGNIGFDFNKANGDIHTWAKVDLKDNEGALEMEYDLTLVSTDETPNTEKPADAKNFMELIGALQTGTTSGFEQMYTPSDMDALLNQSLAPLDDTEL